MVNETSIALFHRVCYVCGKEVAFMDAEMFGKFLAQTRRKQNMTQAELAEQLHVTDKAVSRWERGIGLPDINLLEPLAEALGITLADLMHCREPQEEQPGDVTLEDFMSMLRRQRTIDWYSVRMAMFWLSVILAVVGLVVCKGEIIVQLHREGGTVTPSNEMQAFVIFPLLAVGELFALELWNMYEQFGLFRKWGEKNAVITRSMMLCSPMTRWIKIGMDFFFFVVCGFAIPAAEFSIILLNK